MEAQVRAAAEAVKAHVRKHEAALGEMYKKYITASDEDVQGYTTHEADIDKLETAILKLDKVSRLVHEVVAAAGSYGGSGGMGTRNQKTLLATMKKKIEEAKKKKPSGPAQTNPRAAAAPPKPAAAQTRQGKPLPSGYLEPEN